MKKSGSLLKSNRSHEALSDINRLGIRNEAIAKLNVDLARHIVRSVHGRERGPFNRASQFWEKLQSLFMKEKGPTASVTCFTIPLRGEGREAMKQGQRWSECRKTSAGF